VFTWGGLQRRYLALTRSSIMLIVLGWVKNRLKQIQKDPSNSITEERPFVLSLMYSVNHSTFEKDQ